MSEPKYALITGANTGLGLAAAYRRLPKLATSSPSLLDLRRKEKKR